MYSYSGPFNKMLEYTRTFHFDSLVVFRRALKAADSAIVSGYSFRDKGVNAAIMAAWRERGAGSSGCCS